MSVEHVMLLRLYLDPSEIVAWGDDKGYPRAWVTRTAPPSREGFIPQDELVPRIPDYVRFLAGHRCERCKHPFVVGATPGQWSRCDAHCTHGEPIRVVKDEIGPGRIRVWREAQWRVLTVHHLNGVKHDCRWWNLVSLCQRCHLVIQSKVYMDRPWTREHSEWFKPYAAGYYAWRFLEQDLNREEVMERLEELLALEDRQLEL